MKLSVSNKTVKAGQADDIYIGVDSLKNYKGETLSVAQNVTAKGSVDFQTPGTYKVTYTATEKNYPSRKVSAAAIITVVE